MYIPLQTYDVWTTEGDFSPGHLFEALPHILTEGDLLVFGSYEPSEEVNSELIELGATRDFEEKAYSTSFRFNLSDHPQGRPYELHYSSALIPVLCDLAGLDRGQTDKQLFFDHLLGFRRSVPCLPLFDFHDAFHGGSLRLSGHYSRETVSVFSGKLGRQIVSIGNPDHTVVTVEPALPANDLHAPTS